MLPWLHLLLFFVVYIWWMLQRKVLKSVEYEVMAWLTSLNIPSSFPNDMGVISVRHIHFKSHPVWLNVESKHQNQQSANNPLVKTKKPKPYKLKLNKAITRKHSTFVSKTAMTFSFACRTESGKPATLIWGSEKIDYISLSLFPNSSWSILF